LRTQQALPADSVAPPKCPLNTCIYKKLCVRGLQEIIAQKAAVWNSLKAYAEQAKRMIKQIGN